MMRSLGCRYGRAILVPFLLAVALKYLLTPLISVLSCDGLSCRCKMSRGLAIFFAMLDRLVAHHHIFIRLQLCLIYRLSV